MVGLISQLFLRCSKTHMAAYDKRLKTCTVNRKTNSRRHGQWWLGPPQVQCHHQAPVECGHLDHTHWGRRVGVFSVAGNETLRSLLEDDLFAFLAQAARLPEGFDDEDGQIAWRKDDVNTNSPKTTHSSFWCAGCSSRATVCWICALTVRTNHSRVLTTTPWTRKNTQTSQRPA